MIPIAIWGASGHALIVTEILHLTNHYNIVAYVDDITPRSSKETFLGRPILCTRQCLLNLFTEGIKHVALAVGNNVARNHIFSWLQDSGFIIVGARHPSSVVSRHVKIGAGVLLCAGAVVSPGVTLGDGVIINTAATVDHGCTISSFVHIAPGAKLAGDVFVGQRTFVGMGSVIIEKISIGEDTMIGAGSVVLTDIPSHSVAYGVPARIRKDKSQQAPLR